MPEPDAQPPGPASDAQGRTVIDPTTNVKEAQAGAVQRLDDMAALRAKMSLGEVKALRREVALRSRYEEKLAKKESERLDAIRQRDNEQVASAAEVQRAAANTLAATVDRSAEAMRSAQAQAAQTVAATLDAKINPILSSIGDLQRFQFEAQGQKTQVVETQAVGQSRTNWTGIIIAASVAVVSLFTLGLMAVGTVVTIYALTR